MYNASQGQPQMNVGQPVNAAPQMNISQPVNAAPQMNISQPVNAAPQMNAGRPLNVQPQVNANQEILQEIKKLKSKLNLSIVINFITLACCLVMLIIGLVAFAKVKKIVTDVKPMFDTLQSIDIANLQETFSDLGDTVGSVDWQRVSDVFNNFDIEGIQEVFDKLDVDQLNTTLQNVDEATQTMQDIGDKLKPLIEFFGG